MKPEEEKELALIDAKFHEACNNPKKLIKIYAGWYVVSLGPRLPGMLSEVIEIDHLDEGPSQGWWIAREWNSSWHSDAYPTLRDLKEALGL